MTASFEQRAANSEFKAEISERRAASYEKQEPSSKQEAARKNNWAARTELRVEESKHWRGSYEQQETRYKRQVASSGQQKANIVEQIVNSLQRGRRSDWREVRNSKRVEQQSAWSAEWSADERREIRKVSLEQRVGNNEQHVASNKQRAVGYEKQNDSEKQRTKQREASSE